MHSKAKKPIVLNQNPFASDGVEPNKNLWWEQAKNDPFKEFMEVSQQIKYDGIHEEKSSPIQAIKNPDNFIVPKPRFIKDRPNENAPGKFDFSLITAISYFNLRNKNLIITFHRNSRCLSFYQD